MASHHELRCIPEGELRTVRDFLSLQRFVHARKPHENYFIAIDQAISAFRVSGNDCEPNDADLREVVRLFLSRDERFRKFVVAEDMAYGVGEKWAAALTAGAGTVLTSYFEAQSEGHWR